LDNTSCDSYDANMVREIVVSAVNINADLGESFGPWTMGADDALMQCINSANIACGMHAGDPGTMARTVRLALAHGVSVGAHPSFQDLVGFGRRPMHLHPQEIEELVLYQIGALQAIALANGSEVSHVKPHGALNNMAHDDMQIALAIARGIAAAGERLIFVANACSAMVAAGRLCGLKVAIEVYADRRYDAKARLLPRQQTGSVIHNPQEAAAHVLKMLRAQAVFSNEGHRIPTAIHTICLHGDNPEALAISSVVRDALRAERIDLVPLPKLFTTDQRLQ
jgi:5-oxoprolinase (ATP-hydrolysing) subunit A